MLEAVRSVDPAIRFYQASSSEMFGKVREVPQNEDDAVLPAQPVRRREGLRPLHHGELPRELRHVRGLGHPLQPRVAAARPRVRDAQDHRRRRAHQARARRASSASGNLDAQRDWGFAGDYVRAMWLMLQQDAAGDYVVATGSHAHHPRRLRGRVRPRRARLGAARRDRRALPAPGRGRPARRRREQGRARARLDAGGHVRADDGDDGRRRPRAALSG